MGIAVDDDVAQEVEQFGRAILPGLEREEFRSGVDECRSRLAAAEIPMLNHVLKERNVGLHAANSELRESAMHAVHRNLVVLTRGDDLHEHGVVEGRDDRAGIAHRTVQPDAEATGGAVGEQLAVVGRELVLGVFGGDAALDRVAVAGNLILRRHADFAGVQRVALGDQDLRPNEVESGEHLGHGVLHLDPRIHLDKEPLVLIQVVEEFDGAGVVVADVAGDPGGGVAQFANDVLGQTKARGDFDDLLMSALNGAVPFVEVNDVAVLIPENLHLDVFGAGNVLLEKHGRIAEGATGFALGLVEQLGQFRFLLHHPHAASTTAEGRFDDEGKADGLGRLESGGAICQGFLGSGQRGHAHSFGNGAGGGFVAHHFQDFRARSDEGDSGAGAGAGELGILAQEAVARMNGIDAFGLGDGDDAFDVEIGCHRALALSHLIGLIGLEPVDAEAVFLGVDGDRAQAEFGASAKDADGDLGPIGGHEFPKNPTGRFGGQGGGFAIRHR